MICKLMVQLMLVLVMATLSKATIRIGIVGTDTSHSVEFTRLLNDSMSPNHVNGGIVVAAFKGGSPDIPSSRDRVDRFAEELRTRWHVEIVPDITSLCDRVDAILLESGDGRVHLEQMKIIVMSKKPVFIDKPLASTLRDAREISRVAAAAGVPWFSSSSLRYGEIANTLKGPGLKGASVWGPGPWESHHYLELSWYAIHSIELLYTLMGPGCVEVTRVSGGNAESGADVVIGRWLDGRVGTVRTLRPYGHYGATVFDTGGSGETKSSTEIAYAALLRQIILFFQTRQTPVPNSETLEIFEFLDAAQRSKETGGRPQLLR
jgi:Oxidoreductase family, NAD-binding Rossmann fold